ncbi:MAG: DnaA/Hda family protein [Elusimicrobiota bacterium]
MTMLTRWRIEKSPTDKDPHRQILLLKGSLSDVRALIRRLGAMCGRPKKEKGDPDFNFRLYLHGLNAEALADVEAQLRSLAEGAPAPTTPAAAGPGEASAEAPARAVPEDGRHRAPAGVDAAPLPEPPKEDAPSASQAPESGGEAPAGPGPETAPEPAGPAEAGAAASAEEAQDSPDFVDLSEEGAEQVEGVSTGAQSSGISLHMPSEGAAAAPVAQPAAEPAVGTAGQAAGSEAPGLERLAAAPLCGGVAPADDAFTMETLMVGPFNRFAHAAAMSVLTSPGTLYNPMFFFGGSGSGKSHLLHALAQKLQEQAGDQPVWVTSGARLARAVALAVSSGKLGELEEFAGKSKALLVDDVHLLGVGEENREALARIFKTFFDASIQVVLSSAYSARMLGGLEEALEFRLAAGHVVELKQPREELQKDIAAQTLQSRGVAADPAERDLFADRILQDFPGLESCIRRLLALRKLRSDAGQGAAVRDLLPVLFAPDAGEPVRTPPEELKSALASAAASAPPADGDRDTALLFPEGEETHAEWIWRQLHESARQNGWPFPFRRAVRMAFSLEQAAAAPFLVAEECIRAGVAAALVLGPPPGSDLAGHESEFRYVAEHLLRDGPVALGWIPFNRVKDPKYSVLAYLDMIAGAPGGGER